MNVLILRRDYDVLGGAEKYFLKIKDKFTEPIEHFTMGRRPGERGGFSFVTRLAGDYFRLMLLLKKKQFDVIHINPSIHQKSFFRDGIFHLLCKLFGQKTLIFFRGWHPGFEATLDRHPWMFRLLYGRANGFIVLSTDYERMVRAWGARAPVFREVTIADDDELMRFDVERQIAIREQSNEWRILFAASVIRDKGIYELVQAVSRLQKEVKGVKLIVAGDGKELEAIKRYAKSLGITNAVFTGYITGEEKDNLFKTSHIFCLPTYYEGFPNAVVEAMAVGLPVVTRTVGGLRDFFVNRTHGFATESKDPNVFADFLKELIDDRDLYRRVSLNNYRYVQQHLLASQAAIRLQGIYRAVAQNSSGGSRFVPAGHTAR